MDVVGRKGPRQAALLPDVPHFPQPDWVSNRLLVRGPAAEVAAFREAAAGAGVVPWRVDDLAAEERWLALLLSVPAGERGMDAAGARGLATALRSALSVRREEAATLVNRSTSCPLDLHALVPVPPAVLALGPDDPAALRWLWANWGTTWPLRRVGVAEERPGRRGWAAVAYTFFSADWSPWPVLKRVRRRWRGLLFEMAPRHA